MYNVTVVNGSPFPFGTHQGATIRPGETWTSPALGNGYIHSAYFGSLMLIDLGEQHIGGDSKETWGVLITYQEMNVVGRYEGGGQLHLAFNELCQVTVTGMHLRQVVVDPLIIGAGLQVPGEAELVAESPSRRPAASERSAA